jgi:hypothetical protein
MDYAEIEEDVAFLSEVLTCSVDDYRIARGIGYKTFYTQLYVEHPSEDEATVRRAFDDANGFLIVQAPVGGGKTTLVRRWYEDFVSHRGQEAFLIDFRELAEKAYWIEEDMPVRMTALHAELKEALTAHYLGAEMEADTAFTAKALDRLFPRRKLQLLRTLDLPASTSEDALAEALMQHPEVARTESEFARDKSTLAGLVEVIMALRKCKKFMLFLDNVDRLNPDLQPHLLSIAIDAYNGGRGAYGTVVCLRNKNIHRYEPYGAGGDVVEIVSLTGTREKARRRQLADASDDFLARLFSVRQDYVLRVIGKKGRVQQHVSFCSSVRTLKDLSNTQFIRERLYHLANHDYRLVLVLSAGFVRYLLRLSSAGIIRLQDGIHPSDWECRSFLYRWTYTVMNPEQQWLRNPIRGYGDFAAAGSVDPVDSCLDVMLATWLQNGHSPCKYRDVVDAFRSIGVSGAQVRKSLFALYSSPTPERRHVELGDKEKNLEEDELYPGTRIELLPLGREYVRFVITKFEFLLQALQYPDVLSETDPSLLRPVGQIGHRELQVVLDHLATVRKVHSLGLQKIAGALKSSGCVDWEAYYRAHFCIGGQLALERMAASHLRYLRELDPALAQATRPAYVELLRAFYDASGLKASPESALPQL